MNSSSMEGGSDGESTEYETDEDEDTMNSAVHQGNRREDDDFGLPSDEEENEHDGYEEENLNSTGKFTSINNNSNNNKGVVLSNRYERGNSGSGNRQNSASNNKMNPSSSQGKMVPNQHYDEVYEANEDEIHSIPSPEHTPRDDRVQIGGVVKPIPSSNIAVTSKSDQQPHRMQQDSEEEEEEEEEDDEEEGEEEEEEEEGEEEEDKQYSNAVQPQQPRPSHHAAYNANESNMLLSKLNISTELKELFTYIGRYKPHEIELETKMKPFIPDYMAAVGELDPFLKVKRPDLKEDELDDLGLKVVDEPNPQQSDPTVVTLDLTYQMKGDVSGANITSTDTTLPSGITIKKPEAIVKTVESGNDKLIQKWINDIRELHKKKPPPTVQYSTVNVDFTQLIQAWPDAFEEELARTDLPGADLDVDLEEYIKIICCLLDIPVHEGNLIESLHVLFTLYLEFKTNQHIQSQMNF